MPGFFSAEEVTMSTRNVKQETCVACGLYKTVKTPRMEPFGNGKRGIMVIGEAPGETEDTRGKQWQGKVGKRLQEAMQELGFDLFDDCLCFNSVNCRPTKPDKTNRMPTPKEIACCRPRVLKAIDEFKPKVILLLGGPAVISLIGHRFKKDLSGIFKWRGWAIPDRHFNAWLCPTFHPSFTERSEKEVETIWMQDLEHALSFVNKPYPQWVDERTQVEIITDLSILDTLGSPFTFDFEATGLKPHNQTIHHLVCMSAYDGKRCFAFMMPTDPKNKKRLHRLLTSDRDKIAQNMKYEHQWAFYCLGIEIQNWLFDPMLASHVLDNRPDITSLAFQAYVNFGVIEYKDYTDPFLSADKKNANSVNKIDELVKTPEGKRELLIRCGLDSIYEYRLAMLQMKQLNF
jgi:uracil-DNA glycosylase